MAPSPFSILVLTDTNIGGKAGAEQHLKKLALRLDPERYRMHVIQLAASVPVSEGTVGCATFEHRPTGHVFSPSGLRTIARAFSEVRRLRADCVVSFFESSDIIAGLLSYVMRDCRFVSSRRDTGFRHSGLIKRAYRLLNGRFDRVIAASHAIRESLIAEGVTAEQIDLIHNGVYLPEPDPESRRDNRARYGLLDGDFAIACVANLSPVKDHATLIEVTHALVSQGRPVKLLLAGDGDERQRLQRQVGDRGLSDAVQFLGRIEDVTGLLSAADVFALASKTEGLSNAILEAQAASLPVVATDVGGNAEIVADGRSGFLVPQGDPEAFVSRMATLIDDARLREDMGREGRRIVARGFSVDRMVAQYEQSVRGAGR